MKNIQIKIELNMYNLFSCGCSKQYNNYLCSTNIVLGIRSHLEMIKGIWETVHSLYANNLFI
jgi:hypothetical protein